MYSGQFISDRLRLVRQLGAGGMGSVWVAHHLMLDTEVAIKFTSSAVGATEAGMARFEREARAAAKLKSPHVIKIYDYGRTAEGVPFIVMELLGGADLGTVVQRWAPGNSSVRREAGATLRTLPWPPCGLG